MRPDTKVSTVATRDRANAVVERLSALQNNHRLAIHVVENYGAFVQADHQTIALLDETTPEMLPARLSAYRSSDISTHAPLFSMSLLPSSQSGWSMVPYATLAGEANNFAYLFDLSQDQPNAPRIIRADPHDLISGFDFHNKRIGFERNRSYDFEQFYHKIAGTNRTSSPVEIEEGVIHAIAGPRGGEYSDTQLDMLANMPMGERYKIDSFLDSADADEFGEHIAPWNELIVAASRPHLNAICVPVFERAQGRAPCYLEQRRLQAALVGLDHIDHEFDLPVMLYHVSQPNQGTLSFVGQTKQELTIAALEALKGIGKTSLLTDNPLGLPQTRINSGNAAIQHHLGIDLSLPANGPNGWKAQLDEKLAALRATSRVEANTGLGK